MITISKENKNILEKNALKPTFIRLQILEYCSSVDSHPSVDMIYNHIKSELPTISKTSIYNTLNLFVEKGILKVITIKANETRYDFKKTIHQHFFCEECGKIWDLDIKCDIFKIKNFDGHELREQHGYFKGICKECIKKHE